MIKVLKGFYDKNLKRQKSALVKSMGRFLALLNGKTNNQK